MSRKIIAKNHCSLQMFIEKFSINYAKALGTKLVNPLELSPGYIALKIEQELARRSFERYQTDVSVVT